MATPFQNPRMDTNTDHHDPYTAYENNKLRLFCNDCGAFLRPMMSKYECIYCRHETSNMNRGIPVVARDSVTSQRILGTMRTLGQQDKEMLKKRNRDKSHAHRQPESAKEDEHGGEAVIEEQCPSCKHNRLSYRTAQLRSADEGQTIFYTCLKCKYRFTVNS
eukprot:CAMPEP_0184707548 /NCGR_PEP_ID=MMETSP0313-20130426/37325_1 /TAXON_ID=2792 /ORGANISM="Porphyridium aerugineum, Strain SAG 1380-2" /LENGTH=161 /DNA_ID=CAMNT_0027169125 /DNA_START=48 /DNA_END=533 /DNA_ORIENTATION=+